MGFKCGIVGLPNVGKSTLFNALTATQAAESANYPFCTIEPNTGRVGVPDPRLDRLAAIAGSAKVIPTQLEFVDIAGLVRGASRGEGLGNQFLANIRECDAVAHVLRCFGGEVTHVEGSIDAVRDAETVETELMLADMQSLERRLETAIKKVRGGDKEAKAEFDLMERALALLQAGRPARDVALTAEERPVFRRLQLLTDKPVLYVCNVAESEAAAGNDQSRGVAEKAAAEEAEAVTIAAAIESEVAQLTDPGEKREFLAALDLEEPGLHKVIRAGYRLLGLITFFTVGPKEARAWTVPKGATAWEAAGCIHSDFQRGFIRAETIDYDTFVAMGGEQACKDAGKMRQEGKEYIVQDGDVFHFRFNV
ncbi:MAG: redox-regulated ATPase YchF [Alphaproteobacteria bacterium]|jgi:GTP-binding protein YchF|nr:redox-regulated ATPase YchF [Alphaproteobacteria bacterium]